jgi:hypothetical protein
MRHLAVPGPVLDTHATMIVDLDAPDRALIPWTPPAVVDGVIVTHPPYVSPLDADENGIYPTRLRGGVVTDPVEIRRIHARVFGYKTPRSCGNCGTTLSADGTCTRCDRPRIGLRARLALALAGVGPADVPPRDALDDLLGEP